MKHCHLTLQQKLMAGYSALLIGILLLLGSSIIPQRLQSFETELDNQISLTAHIIAESSDARDSLIRHKASPSWTAFLDNLTAETSGIDYIVVADTNGQRIYHPDHTLIGEQFAGGDEAAAEQGGAPYITMRAGTNAGQRRAFHTIYDDSRNPIGFIMVSASLDNIQREKQELLVNFLLIFAAALLVGLVLAWLLAQNVRTALLGHEPRTFAQMFLQREEVLDHLNECLLAIAPDGRLLFTNARAREVVGTETLPEKFPLQAELHETFATGRSYSGLLTEWADYTFLAKIIPLDQAGVLLILRDRTEYARIDQQLTGTNHVIEALRANTHEFLNKLHVISGLLQIGETAKAIEFIQGITSDLENNYQSIVRRLENRTVAALVLGKASHANELGIQFSLRPDSALPLHSAYLSSHELVTIIGNLVENAFEAVKSEPLRQVELFIGENDCGLTIAVDDTGHGMSDQQIQTIRERQYTTKGEGHGFGLRLIQQIVADRNGYLDIESEPGEGSSFTVNFSKKREGVISC